MVDKQAFKVCILDQVVKYAGKTAIVINMLVSALGNPIEHVRSIYGIVPEAIHPPCPVHTMIQIIGHELIGVIGTTPCTDIVVRPVAVMHIDFKCNIFSKTTHIHHGFHSGIIGI